MGSVLKEAAGSTPDSQSGSSCQSVWGEYLSEPWARVAETISGSSHPREAQGLALEAGLMESRRNLIVSSPTNSGKSLIGTLVLLDAVKRGRRAILIEPLRALANEQSDSLKRVVEKSRELLGSTIAVKVTTGDFRLQAEEFTDPAPEGELIVCTPERLDAIFRNPDSQAWIESIGAVVLDEAHLISNPRRGATQEFLLTSLLQIPVPPRLVLLSATLGDLGRAQEWLAPCDVVRVARRYPPLEIAVRLIADGDANLAILEWLREVLATRSTQCLIFVYQTRAAVKLADELTKQLGALVGQHGAVAYHAQMSMAQRESARQQFLTAESRVAVTTSALAMGVNLPTTHVLVRDLTYPGAKSPEVGDLLQMAGRAGRGDTPGSAVILLRSTDDWTEAELRAALEEERLPEFRSAFTHVAYEQSSLDGVLPVVGALLARSGEQSQTPEQLERFLQNSLGGGDLVAQVGPALRWLQKKTLAYEEDGCFALTVLGARAVRSVLPLDLAAGFAQLLRDLMTVDPQDELIAQWTELDFLVVLHLLYDRAPSLRPFSRALAEQVNGRCQGRPTIAPVLFRRWIDGEKGYSKAAEVFASLGVPAQGRQRDPDEAARKRGYQATLQSIVLFELGKGRNVADLSRQFGLKNLEGVQERWRDDMLWLLSGLIQILEIRAFYHHLLEACEANPERIQRVKKLLKNMRTQAYSLQGQLVHCSPLGGLLQGMKRMQFTGVGEKSIRTLEGAGADSLLKVFELGADGMVDVGVRRDIADKIERYLKQRMV